ncbi:Ig-like domain-containing protein [candidate division KSB1 bacterium]|nr:Ig-like domain-containing protein [candidate division KSB1 bacterium]
MIDVNSPGTPSEIGFFDTRAYAYGVAVSGNYAYVADMADGMYILEFLVYPPESPILNQPINNSLLNDNTPILNWSIPADKNTDSLHFKVEIVTDNNFVNQIPGSPFESCYSTIGFIPMPPLPQGNGTCSFTLTSGLADGEYWCRVSAWDGQYYGEVSEERKFTIDTTAPYTTNHNPSIGATNVSISTNITVHVKDDFSGVKRDSLALKVNDIEVLFNIEGTSADYVLTYNPPDDFDYDQIVSISIDAEDSLGNKMPNDYYKFTTEGEGVNIAPAAPLLSYPENDSYIKDDSPQFSWQIPNDDNEDALHFKIELDNDNNWTTVNFTYESKNSTSGFSPTPPVPEGTGSASYTMQSVMSEGDWWWRVAAWDGQIYGSYSNKYQFILDTKKPYTSGHNPAKNAANIPTNTNISVSIEDSTSGVDQSSIVMKVNGDSVNPAISGSSLNYTLTYNPENDFDSDAIVTVSIDAEDFAGNKMETDNYYFTTAQLDTTHPRIEHTPVDTRNSSESINIEAQITDNVGIKEAKLHYRMGGALVFQTKEMTNVGGYAYQDTIPAGYINERGVEYYISAKDSSDNQAFCPETANNGANPLIVRVRSSNLKFAEATKAMTYQMISVPNNLLNKSARDVLVDDLGSYDDTQWRLLRYVNGHYTEYTVDNNFDDFTPGNGFWLITRNQVTLDAGTGYSLTTAQRYSVTLQPGSNQIGNPFAFTVNWSDIIKTDDVEDNLVGYDGSSYSHQLKQLRSWEAYFVKNFSSSTTTIEIPAVAAVGGLGKKAENILAQKTFQDDEWGLQIIADCDHYLDKDNYLGCLCDASDAWDHHDFSEPPFFIEYVSLYFPHDDWEQRAGLYTADFRQVSAEGQYWDFHVKTNITNSEVTLTLTDIQNLPADWDIILIDRASNVSQNFRDKPAYVFYSGKEETMREFRIIVGQANFVEENDLDILAAPHEFELAQNYPNPFNPETQISYSLPAVSSVTIAIYNVKGQLIRMLVDERQSAGRYRFAWNGMNDHGEKVVSGVYFVRLVARGFVAVRKMSLIH